METPTQIMVTKMKNMPKINAYFIDVKGDKIVHTAQVSANAPMQALKQAMDDFKKSGASKMGLSRIVLDLELPAEKEEATA